MGRVFANSPGDYGLISDLDILKTQTNGTLYLLA